MIIRYKNAHVLDKDGEYFGNVYTCDGKILYAGKMDPRIEINVDIDVGGRLLMPAFVDMHCHLRDPGFPQKETMETGMRAALKGGYATLVAMANTSPVCDNVEIVKKNHELATRLGLCNLIQSAAAGIGLKDETPTDYAALAQVTRVITNDGNTIFSDAFFENLLVASKEYGFIISTHCQPERQIVGRDIGLLSKVGGNLHVGHISHRETVDMIRRAKSDGLSLTCEVTPHHLFGADCDYKVNPPLRSKADVKALVDGIKDGTVDVLATDHAPHTQVDKDNGMAGISNIEYAMQVYFQTFYENEIPLTTFSRLASYNPASILGINAGLIREGLDADMVIVNPDYISHIDKANMISRSHNTPFDGRLVRGLVEKTIVGGDLRYDNGQVI